MSAPRICRRYALVVDLALKNTSKLGKLNRIGVGETLFRHRQHYQNLARVARLDLASQLGTMREMSSSSSLGATQETPSVKDDSLNNFKSYLVIGNLSMYVSN